MRSGSEGIRQVEEHLTKGWRAGDVVVGIMEYNMVDTIEVGCNMMDGKSLVTGGVGGTINRVYV